jgi:hypothetical protein
MTRVQQQYIRERYNFWRQDSEFKPRIIGVTCDSSSSIPAENDNLITIARFYQHSIISFDSFGMPCIIWPNTAAASSSTLSAIDFELIVEKYQ